MRNPIDLSKEAFGILVGNIRLFLIIMLVPIALSFISALFAPTQAEQMVGIGISPTYLVMMVISGIVNIFMGIALILVLQNRSLGAMEAYKQSTPFFWRYIGMSIIMSVLIFVGFLLLIVPGVILAVWFAFSTFILVLERAGVIESLKKSREYVRGHWWAVFGRLIVMAIILIVVSMIISALSAIVAPASISAAITSALALLFAPFAMAYMYLMYQDLQTHSSPVSEPVAPTVQ